LERVLPFILSFFLPLAGAGLLLRWVVASHVGLAGKWAATVENLAKKNC
jgi:hypothetical protein